MAPVEDVLNQATLKKLLAGKSCDFVDRLHHKVTVTILIAFAIVVSAKQFVGDPIHCWVPAQYKESWQTQYVNFHCWVQNTYFVSFDGLLPTNVDSRLETEITYYQWVPLILLVIALLFVLPHILYRTLCSYSGVNLSRIADLADRYVGANKDDRKATIEQLAVFIDKWLHLKARKRELTRCHQVEGHYLVLVYLLTKLMYLALVVCAFFLLKEFLDLDFFAYGANAVHSLANNEKIRESPRFPRITFCDMKVRQLQNVITYTIQCVLPINLFSEKIFVFLWFWFLFLGAITFINTVKWLYLLLWRSSNYSFVKKHLVLHHLDNTKQPDKRLCRRFAENYIGDDGCFLFRMMSINSTDLVVNAVLAHLWKQFQEHHKMDQNHT